MLSPRSPKVVQLAEELGRAQRLGQENQNDEAHAICLRLIPEAEALGLVSSELFWSAAAVADRLGDFPLAVELCGRAMEADPLAPSVRNSWGIILRRVREALLDESRKVDDFEVPKLYTLLADVGGADESCHVRFAAYLVAASKAGEARSLLTALLKLYPKSLDGWTLLAQVAEPGDLERLKGSQPSTKLLVGPQRALFPQLGPAQG
jgi:hypothetical protein